jgi:peptide/nickel transport system permease protein
MSTPDARANGDSSGQASEMKRLASPPAEGPTPEDPSSENTAPSVREATRQPGLARRAWRHWGVRLGGFLALLMVLTGVCAPLLSALDPAAINPANRNKPPGHTVTIRDEEGNKTNVVARMGTDSLGRDVFTRVVYGARVSLVVGLSVAVVAVAVGLAIGVLAGYFRAIDGVLMRVMDGLMAIPAILLAIALVSLSGANLLTVVVAVAVPEIPRVVRLVRSVVLSIREEPYVEAAIASGTPTPKVLLRHVLPNTYAPLIVQATFICGSAILVEAILSFLGVGLPPEIPTWGNVMAEGRTAFQVYPHTIIYPGVFLTLTVLAINMLGDGLRDTLDPRMSRRI